MVNTFTIKFSKYGSVLTTRRLGREIRTTQIENRLRSNHRIVFDFSEVDLVTHSFADECFGKLLEDFDLVFVKSTTTFESYNKKVKIQIIRVINHNLELNNKVNM